LNSNIYAAESRYTKHTKPIVLSLDQTDTNEEMAKLNDPGLGFRSQRAKLKRPTCCHCYQVKATTSQALETRL